MADSIIINFRVDKRLIDLFNRYSKENNISRSDLIRSLVIDSKGNLRKLKKADIDLLKRMKESERLRQLRVVFKQESHCRYLFKNTISRIYNYAQANAIMNSGSVSECMMSVRQEINNAIILYENFDPELQEELKYSLDLLKSFDDEDKVSSFISIAKFLRPKQIR